MLGQLYKLTLQGHGYDASLKLNLGSLNIVAPALESGEVGITPAYTGAAVAFFSKNEVQPTSDGDEVYALLTKLLANTGVVAFASSSAQNKNGFAVTQKEAEAKSLKTIGDLEPFAPQWTLGGPPTCPKFDSCLPGLEKVYGIQFKDFKDLDFSGPLTISALLGDQIQVAVIFTTSPSIVTENFVLLEDTKNMLAAQNAVPLASRRISEAYGKDFEDVLNALSKTLTTDDLIAMNTAVEVDLDDPDEVAYRYLIDKGLLPKTPSSMAPSPSR